MSTTEQPEALSMADALHREAIDAAIAAQKGITHAS